MAGDGGHHFCFLGQIRQAFGLQNDFQCTGAAQLIQSAQTLFQGVVILFQLYLCISHIRFRLADFLIQLFQPLIGGVNLLLHHINLFFQRCIVLLLFILVILQLFQLFIQSVASIFQFLLLLLKGFFLIGELRERISVDSCHTETSCQQNGQSPHNSGFPLSHFDLCQESAPPMLVDITLRIFPVYLFLGAISTCFFPLFPRRSKTFCGIFPYDSASIHINEKKPVKPKENSFLWNQTEKNSGMEKYSKTGWAIGSVKNRLVKTCMNPQILWALLRKKSRFPSGRIK